MMISPETFYDENLKGKSAEEILSVIRRLKQTIGRLKNIVEHPDYVKTMCPGEDVQISCNRDYLERAKQALAEVGGTYTPSQAELRAEKFNANLPYVSCVEFNINSFYAGYEEKIYTIEDGELTIEGGGTIPPDPYDFRDDEMDKDTLINGLADLHIGEWRREYAPKRFDISVCDVFTWNLNIYFSNGARPVKIDGCNNAPYNFEQLLELFNMELFTMDDSRETCSQKTIHEKWEESEITILPPEEKPIEWESYEDAKKRIDAKEREKQIKKKLRDPNLSDKERDELMDLLWEGIDVKESGNFDDFDTEAIDKLFETVTPDLVFTGTGYNPDKIPPKKKG